MDKFKVGDLIIVEKPFDEKRTHKDGIYQVLEDSVYPLINGDDGRHVRLTETSYRLYKNVKQIQFENEMRDIIDGV